MKLFRIRLVAWHVFKESVRDRVLYGIGAFALLLVAASVLIGQVTAGQDLKIIKDLGLSTIEFAGVLMTVFIGVGLVAREIERRSIFALLAKPLPRWEFIIGKYAGLMLTLTVNIVCMTAALYLMLAWLWWTSPENIRLSWDAPALDPHLLISVVLTLGELSMLTAVALLFSTFSSAALWSIVFTVGIYLAGLQSQDVRHFTDIVEAPAFVGRLVDVVGWLLPAFDAFDKKVELVHGLPVPFGFVAIRLGYAAMYSAVALGGAVLAFSRREFR
jgi:ABC-type transport system involved in multi-copper enzyme maturation permease subunit